MNATDNPLIQEQISSSLHRMVRRTVRFTLDDAQRASESWRFNCGPAALCAVLGMTPTEIRPHMLDFEEKGYTNPTLMRGVLNKLGVQYKLSYRSDDPNGEAPLEFGLMRIQLAGPWTKPGVPMRVRYRMTHWVACAGDEVFYVNAMQAGGWIPWIVWVEELVPWIIQHCCPKQAKGAWWPTHAFEVTPNVPDQRPRATDTGHGTQTQSRGSLHPVCSATQSSSLKNLGSTALALRGANLSGNRGWPKSSPRLCAFASLR